jgi:Sulfotransferase family
VTGTPTYEVLDVSVETDLSDSLLGAYIDLPKAGEGTDVYMLHIVGWVLGRHSPARDVEVVYQPEPDRVRPGPERIIRVTPIRGDRVDVAAAFPDVPTDIDCHFESLVGLIGLTPTFELRLRAVLEDETRVPIGSLRVRREPLRTSYEPRFQPISVTCLGRTGTSWLMGMLAAHSRIAAYRHFPYESSPAKYWMQALKVLAEPSNIWQSAHPDTFHGNLWWTGQNPFYDDRIAGDPEHNDFFGREYVESLAEFFQRKIDRWYSTLARTQGQDDPVYFAEKHLWPNYIPVLLRELYPGAKEIFLVRDFRDMTLSILAFDRKRGWPGFGRQEGLTDEEYISSFLKPAAQSMANSWRTRGATSHLVRYEDLVTRPAEVLAGVLEYLELERDAELIETLVEAASTPSQAREEHRTSSDARQSIGRWRHERDDAFREFCNETFAEELAEFGYTEPAVVS